MEKFVGSDFTRGPRLLGDPGIDSGGTRRDITRDQVRLALSSRSRARAVSAAGS